MTRQQALATAPRRKPAGLPPIAIPALLIVIGMVVSLYPIFATYWNNYRQTQFAARYSSDVAQTSTQTLQDQLARARTYNAELPATALHDPWASATNTSPQQAEYLSQLNLYDTVARIRVPRLKINLPIYHGSGEDVLAKGVGHLLGSSLPVGGPRTNAVLTAHSGWASATLFDRLPDIVPGDMIYIDVYGETLAYQVDKTIVVLPSELDRVVHDDADRITLVTCTPRVINTHRLLVEAKRVPYAHEVAPKSALLGMDWSIHSWMVPRYITAGVALMLLLALILHDRHRTAMNRHSLKEVDHEDTAATS